MKKLIFLELIFLFLATTFSSNPPEWYQQTLPVNDNINDIFFLDSLNGWVVTNSDGGNDTGYIIKTSNGGINWDIQLYTYNSIFAIQLLDISFGYAVGGNGVAKVFKTIDGGINWQIYSPFGSNVNSFQDLSFVNKDTGWICSQSIIGGGIFKTTNGGENWFRQLNETFLPTKLFFLNKDTGWSACNMNRLYGTVNGGINWDLQFTSAFPLESIFFLNKNNGWIRGGPNLNENGVSYTTNGGFNWTSAQGAFGGYDIKFINDSVGYTGMDNFKIIKSTNGGRFWGYQSTPVYNNLSVSFLRFDSLLGWGGGNGFVKTNDGGGTIVSIQQVEVEIVSNYILYQNYPNPFNPVTAISYQLAVNSNVKLKVFNIEGKEIAELVNEKQIAGEYKVEFQSNELASGVYFYKIEITNEKSNEVFTEIKKMILVR